MRTITSLALPAALLLVAGCRPSSVTGYPTAPTTSAGDGVEWSSSAERHLKLEPADGTWKRDAWLRAGKDGRLAALLFDLKGVPAGARVSRAVLRLRRRSARGKPQLSVMDVKKGVRALRYGEGDPLYGILRARATTDKRAMLATAYSDESDVRASGLELARYPIECSLREFDYSVTLFKSGKPYHQMLEKWNGVSPAKHESAGAWDEIDVTGMVRAQLAADKLLLVAVRDGGGEVRWFAAGLRYPWASPHLMVDFSGGAGKVAGPVKPVPSPAPKPEPKPGPRPDPKPEPKPTPAPAGGKGRIVIGSSPAKADIYIGGKYVGTTPSRELTFPAGEIKVRIEKKGYQSWERTVTVLKDNVVNVAPELEKK
jgi:hypothetical protein